MVPAWSGRDVRKVMAKDIDFFFFIGSTYTYLTVMRIDRVVAEVGVQYGGVRSTFGR